MILILKHVILTMFIDISVIDTVILGSTIKTRGSCTPFTKNRAFPIIGMKEVCCKREASTVKNRGPEKQL